MPSSSRSILYIRSKQKSNSNHKSNEELIDLYGLTDCICGVGYIVVRKEKNKIVVCGFMMWAVPE
jgi:hypothetical protein